MSSIRSACAFPHPLCTPHLQAAARDLGHWRLVMSPKVKFAPSSVKSGDYDGLPAITPSLCPPFPSHGHQHVPWRKLEPSFIAVYESGKASRANMTSSCFPIIPCRGDRFRNAVVLRMLPDCFLRQKRRAQENAQPREHASGHMEIFFIVNGQAEGQHKHCCGKK